MTQMLRSLGIEDSYRSDRNNVVSEFYVPCLSVANRYDRAVGYFTSKSLLAVARGLKSFERNGGRIRLIASPYLTESDIEDIRDGYLYREVIEKAVLREIDPEAECSPRELIGLGLLGRLIAQDMLDVKIAIVHGREGLALYHEKIGLISDKYGDAVAFTGSMNETASAFLENFESIHVFKSWQDHDKNRVDSIRADFDELWAGRTPRLEILDFPEVAKERFVALRKRAAELPTTAKDPKLLSVSTDLTDLGWARTPRDIQLRDYQKTAVAKWLAASGRGMFQMATGTGKTITALAALDQVGRQLHARNLPLVTVVVVPLLDLVEQWTGELRDFGVVPIKCRDASRSWEPAARNAIAGLRARGQGSVTLVVTNATFRAPTFQRLLDAVDLPMLIIADEAHHLGAEHLCTSLPERAAFRLALSATPERWFDPEGTDALKDYFGKVLIELGLKEAIDLGTLTRYRYYPILVPLSDDEAEQYTELTVKIGALIRSTEPESTGDDDKSPLGMLLGKRAKVLGHARAKIPALREELERRKGSAFQLVYCAEGGVPLPEGGTGRRQVDEVLELVGKELEFRAHTFTSREDKRQRKDLLQAFATGRDLQVLVSMRCLDEGVDLPDARVAYMLASSTNPRQFIQRRGRILRRAPGKSLAEVIDFVVVPPQDPTLFEIERRLFRRELARCVEFAGHAENYGEALAKLRDLRDYYQLLDV
ncbi:DEAD/DEAH box helicase family protein [Sphaerimonospora mesophila]|uniref:DEAD/DEAH box helicase family protein n=1 Tax=Sphaerimonospora mesophila TaxID=37483 RepID=UPI0006E14ACF